MEDKNLFLKIFHCQIDFPYWSLCTVKLQILIHVFTKASTTNCVVISFNGLIQQVKQSIHIKRYLLLLKYDISNHETPQEKCLFSFFNKKFYSLVVCKTIPLLREIDNIEILAPVSINFILSGLM